MTRRRSHKQERTDALLQAAEQLSGHAHRWAVSQAADVSDAFVFDAACAVLAAHRPAAPQRTSSAATAERRKRHGAEEPADEFALPVTLEESARVLHRFARRHANGRGYDTASTVNGLTRRLLALDVDLDETRQRDGTLWAVNGRGPLDSTLTPEQRREAESALPPRQRDAR